MKDSFGRRINYLRISVTDLCNYRCKYCMPEDGVTKKGRSDLLSLEEIYYISHIFVEEGVDKIRITGGEPLLRKGLVNLVESLGQLESVKDLSMTTNASLLSDKAVKLKKSGLDRLNISLDTLDKEKFQAISGGNLDDVIQGIKAASDAGLGIKINTVLLKGVNDDEIYDFIDLSKKYPIDIRFIELMPIGPTASYARDKFLSGDEIIETYDLRKTEKDDPNSPADLYKIDGGLGRIGFIKAMSHKFCGDCNRIRLTADGYLKPCLHSDKQVDIKTPLRRGEDIRPYIKKALEIKPYDHKLLEGKSIKRSMNRIGG
ncbi:GTP 3',8-cyclase MoaA [Anaerococcus sp. AGMB09787]|uniref:GTP 3',8-cyclase MoaA n=1 Tax=Anaerococcus sp. AGMB09787 TaxID=2922869 RepID=UPI001FAEA346|nr:GTP 3',8-cyclase MoaA [Anaerococcus sp. AGMB09787]